MKNIQNKKLAIVGGGPGGLTLARLLQMNGADVTVYERDIHKDARAKGATLDLHEESGLAALQAAGLMNEFRANYRPGADKMRVTDQHAHIILDDHTIEQDETHRNRPEIDRGPLQKILLDSLMPGTVIWDCKLVSLAPHNDGWKLEFKDGTMAIADLVIAADGANSQIRPYITPIKPFFAGITAIEGNVYNADNACPKVNALLKGGKVFAMGNEQSLIVGAKGDGSLAFYAGFKTTETWSRECGVDFSDRAQVLAWFKRDFNGWDSIWDELFENAALPFIPRPQYCMPLDQSWQSLSNLTMLGDAAHLMPPYAGEGVNMAMLDALELSRCLTSNDFADTLQAITAFEKQMLVRASETAALTLESTAALHSVNAINYLTNIVG